MKAIKAPGPAKAAEQAAMSHAARHHLEMAPVTIFHQGDRPMIAGALPVQAMLRLTRHNLTGAGRNPQGRPSVQGHADEIAAYLEEALTKGNPFILPPVILNAKNGLWVYLPEEEETQGAGYAVLPDETEVGITDGQHRLLALRKTEEALMNTPEGRKLNHQDIPFMMTSEPDPDQAGQDFADAARTRPLPPSLLETFDTRHPVTATANRLIQATPLLRGRVDSISLGIGRSSPHLFLHSQVRQFVKSSLTGQPDPDDAELEQAAERLLGSPEDQRTWVRSRADFLEIMTSMIPQWGEAAQLPEPGEQRDLKRIREIKAESAVTLSGAFLAAAGLLSHHLTEQTKDPEEALNPLARTDWSRKAPVWQGNLVERGKIRTGPEAAEAAYQAMRAIMEERTSTGTADNT